MTNFQYFLSWVSTNWCLSIFLLLIIMQGIIYIIIAIRNKSYPDNKITDEESND